MTAIGMFVRKVIALGAFLVLANSVWAAEFSDKAEQISSPSIIESLHGCGKSGEIAFRISERMPDYFKSSDKENKVFAIESARQFRDVPSLSHLTLKIPNDGTVRVLDISRSDIEKRYGVDFAAINGDPNAWRTDFIPRSDTKESRADFVKHFVNKS